MPNMVIRVADERPELERNPRDIARFPNVPENWTASEVVERFGIANHLTVYRSFNGGHETIIQEGRHYISR